MQTSQNEQKKQYSEQSTTLNSTTSYQPIEGLEFFDSINRLIYSQFIGSSNSAVFSFQDPFYGILIALKQIRVPDDQHQQLLLLKMMRQLQRIQKRNHPHILQIFGFCESIKPTALRESRHFCIAMEHADGNLQDIIGLHKQKKDFFKEKDIFSFVCETVSALEYLQKSLFVAHRDVKPENIFVFTSSQLLFQLGDLDDCSVSQTKNKTHERSILISSLGFMAPELVKAFQNQQEQTNYNAYQADVYSLGLCLLYLCTLKKFTNQERLDAVENQKNFNEKVQVLRKEVKSKYNKMIAQILKLMLEPDPFSRVDFIQLKRRLVDKGLLDRSYYQKSNNNSKQASQYYENDKSNQNLDEESRFDSFEESNDWEEEGEQFHSNTASSYEEEEKVVSSSDLYFNQLNAGYMNASNNNLTCTPYYEDNDEVKTQTDLSYDESSIRNSGRNKLMGNENKTMTMSEVREYQKASKLKQKYQLNQSQQSTNRKRKNKKLQDNQRRLLGSEDTDQSDPLSPNQVKSVSTSDQSSKLSSGDLLKFTGQKKMCYTLMIFTTIIIIILGVIYMLGIPGSGGGLPGVQCKENQFLLQNSCTSQCPQGLFAFYANMTCLECQDTCSQCVSDRSDSCLSCKENLVFLKMDFENNLGVCLNSCPQTYYQDDNECLQCDDNCLNCFEGLCSQCDGESYQYDNQCITRCPESSIQDDIQRNCVLFGTAQYEEILTNYERSKFEIQ